MAEEKKDEGQEKSFEASETKIRKAREKGNVPQSKEVNTTLLYIGMLLAITFAGGQVCVNVSKQLVVMLARPEDIAASLLYGTDQQMLATTVSNMLIALFPVFVIPAVFVIASLVGQQSIVFAPTKIKPKLSKISPISNAKQKFGPAGLGEFAKSLTKMLAVGLIASIFVMQQYFELPQLSQMPEFILPSQLQSRTIGLLSFVIVVSAAIAAVDLFWGRYSHEKKLRMTLQEMKDETKENEGDPHQKQARRRRAEAIATNSMLNDVQTADVIIVNPEHYSVALKWDRDQGTVPVCVAKGTDHLAFRIRERAQLADIPIRSDPPCARALYAAVDLGEPIRPEHYAAVAAAIHFADELKKRS